MHRRTHISLIGQMVAPILYGALDLFAILCVLLTLHCPFSPFAPLTSLCLSHTHTSHCPSLSTCSSLRVSVAHLRGGSSGGDSRRDGGLHHPLVPVSAGAGAHLLSAAQRQ